MIKELTEGATSIFGRVFYNPYKKAGITWLQYRLIKYFAKGDIKSHVLNGHPTYFYTTAEYFHGVQEIFANEIYKQELPENPFIVDCGAHIGLSVLYLKKICPSARIVAFEPDAANFRLLQKNVESHALDKVELRNEAIWKENTTISFLNEGSMSSRIESADSGGHTMQVKATRLKDLLNQPVDFLKLDIEGAEYDVLKDIANQLHLVKRMFVEYHGQINTSERLTELFQLFSEAGFSYYIKEANFAPYPYLIRPSKNAYDVQLNIFCFRI